MGVLQGEEDAEYGVMQRPRQGCSSYTVSSIFIMNIKEGNSQLRFKNWMPSADWVLLKKTSRDFLH